jgi:transposase
MFNGKMSDAKSLKEIISAIEEEFEESRMPTIVFDRGMVTDENMAILKAYNGLKFIVMCRCGEEALVANEFENEKFSIFCAKARGGKRKKEPCAQAGKKSLKPS